MMKKYDPEFDLEELTYEAEEIFKEFYCNFLTGNEAYLDIVCGGPAKALTMTTVQLRKKQGWKYKYDELLYCGPTMFQGALVENRVPQFSYHIEVQEFDERVTEKTGQPVEGEKGKLMSNTYRIVLARHDEPQMEITGHYWEIIEFYKIGEVRMIA